MPNAIVTSESTPCGNGWSLDEQVHLNARFDGEALASKDDDSTEDSLEGQQMAKPADEDEDEYTLSAFGDISLSNICFVPGPLEALSPERKADKSASTMSRPVEKCLPEVIRKILPLSPSKAFASTIEMDFESIFNNLKRSRDRGKPQPSSVTSRKSFADVDSCILYSPQPRRLFDLQNFEIDMETVGDGIDEPTRRGDERVVPATPAGSLRGHETHEIIWDGNSEGYGCHLGLMKAVKLT